MQQSENAKFTDEGKPSSHSFGVRSYLHQFYETVNSSNTSGQVRSLVSSILICEINTLYVQTNLFVDYISVPTKNNDCIISFLLQNDKVLEPNGTYMPTQRLLARLAFSIVAQL